MKYKVGDRVEIIGSKTYGPHDLPIGTKGIIYKALSMYYGIKTDSGINREVIEQDLKLIEMKEKISYEFPDGAVISGTADQILAYAKATGAMVDVRKIGIPIPRGFYASETKGLIAISTMDSFHIINALNKRTVEYFTALKPGKDTDIKVYLQKYVELTTSKEIEDLYSELVKRAKLK